MFLCLKLFDRSNILEVPFKKPKASSGTLDAPQVPHSSGSAVSSVSLIEKKKVGSVPEFQTRFVRNQKLGMKQIGLLIP